MVGIVPPQVRATCAEVGEEAAGILVVQFGHGGGQDGDVAGAGEVVNDNLLEGAAAARRPEVEAQARGRFPPRREGGWNSWGWLPDVAAQAGGQPPLGFGLQAGAIERAFGEMQAGEDIHLPVEVAALPAGDLPNDRPAKGTGEVLDAYMLRRNGCEHLGALLRHFAALPLRKVFLRMAHKKRRRWILKHLCRAQNPSAEGSHSQSVCFGYLTASRWRPLSRYCKRTGCRLLRFDLAYS